MEIIEGFPKAKAALSRQVTADFYQVSPALRKKLKELFATVEPEAAV
ncbi:MAG: hypothetical protein P8X92_00155 [Dehalococcoidia bacterium]